MVHKLLIPAAVAALVATVVGGASFASATSSSEGSGKTIVVIEKTTSQHFLDLGKPGPTAGDEFFFGSQFWNTSQTQRVGSNHGYCVLLTKRLVHCLGTARLGGGTIEFAGAVNGSASQLTIAITGGTGAFREAEGQVVIHNLNSQGTLSRDVIELTG
jgi:hypothetical protein